MAGNRRQERKTNEYKAGKGEVSLADALGATQQHSVPVLPASDSSMRKHSSETRASTLSTATHRRQPAVRQHPAAGASEDDYQAHDSNAHTSYARARSARRKAAPPEEPVKPVKPEAAVTDPEMTLEVAKAQLVLPDVIADSIPMENATRVLPAMDTSLTVLPERYLSAELEKPAEPTAILIPGAHRLPRHHYSRVVPRRQGSRPVAFQFIVAMMSVMVLFSIFTAASPLGRSLASLGFVQAYANSAPWIPTATPRPKPKPAPVYTPPSAQAIVNDIIAVFGGYYQGALNVARCESGYDPSAYNPYPVGNSHAEGVFQILFPSTWYTTSYSGDSPYNAYDNILAAHQIFSRDGNSWREWACQP